MNRTMRASAVLLGALVCAGCGGGDKTSGGASGAGGTGAGGAGGAGGAAGTPGQPTRIVVTADFTAQSLSVLDYDKVLAGDSLDEARVRVIELPEQLPGPLQLELTSDGKRAVAAVGPGFFDTLGLVFGFPVLEEGPGRVAVVELESGSVEALLTTAQAPMGLAIGGDDRTAYSANYGTKAAGGSTVSVIDLESLTVGEELEVGAAPEQISLSPDGRTALFNVAGDGSIRTFDVDDPSGTLSPAIPTSDDPSDVVIVAGSRALVVNSRGTAGYSVLDLSDPSLPVVLETVDLAGGIPYGVSAIPGTSRVLVGVATGIPAQLVEVDLATTPSTQIRTIELGNTVGSFPLGVAVSPDGAHAMVALPVAGTLAIVDLAQGSVRHLEWTGDDVGPTYAAIHFASE